MLGRWGLPSLHPPHSVALGFCLEGGSLPRATKRLAGGGCHLHTPLHSPVFRCARHLSCRQLATAEKKKKLGRGGCRPCRPHTLVFRCARLLSCRRLATAGNEALGRWGLSPSRPCILLLSAFVLQTARYRGKPNAWQVGAAAPIPPLFAALGLSCRRLATAGNEALGRWGLLPQRPCFSLRSAFVLQTARYRGQPSAWQVEAAAPTPPLCAALGLSCRRLATAGNEALGRWGLPPPNPAFRCARLLSCRRLAAAGKEKLGRWGLPPPNPAFRCARLLSCRRLAAAGNEALGRGLTPPPPPHPRFPLCSARPII
jgi:hypothetical protein